MYETITILGMDPTRDLCANTPCYHTVKAACNTLAEKTSCRMTGNGIKAYGTAMAAFSSSPKIVTLVNSKMAAGKGAEPICGKMEVNTKENSSKMLGLEKDVSLGLTEIFTRGNSSMGSEKDWVNIPL